MNILQRISTINLVDAVPALTLCLLIFYGFGSLYDSLVIKILTVFVLLDPRLLKNSTFWFIITLLAGSTIYHSWRAVDNHKFLLFYMCLGLFFVYLAETKIQERIIKNNARYLLFFTMFFAVIQKVNSPSYMDGSFFKYILLTDSRFQYLCTFLTDMTLNDLSSNRAVFDGIKINHLESKNIEQQLLITTPQVSMLASAMTWLNLIDQICIAMLCLIRPSKALFIIENIAIYIFIVVVYFIAPVIGFGWTIAILGFSLCDNNHPIMRITYIGMLVLLSIYQILL